MTKCIACGTNLADDNSAFCSEKCFFKLWNKTEPKQFSMSILDNEPWN